MSCSSHHAHSKASNGSALHAHHGKHASAQSSNLLLAVASEAPVSSEDLAVVIDRFMTAGGHDFSKLTEVSCLRGHPVMESLSIVAGLMSLEVSTCSKRMQQAMDKYIQKFHLGVEGLAWQAATVALFTSGRKKLHAEPVLMEVNGHTIAVALCRIKDQPLAEYRSHMVFCGIEPCIPEEDSRAFAHRLRKLARSIGLDSGDRRMKITRSNCCGACRSGSVSVIYENLQPGEMAVNNGSWIAHGDELTDNQWLDIFKAVDERRPLTELLDSRHFVVKQVR
ncbi:hypothetical protein [Parendozoicomonas haliclonae]|uniref:Uncharacterized protein n=1 Tax=Parendozoicomonas haliclonae TaxID=1960125 RepID=A0A1X7AM85_9GAMM|nr:hypothetical protein [Parendozoicomonas haliclonae]SMA48838.1 hypothetical protein EHSB41UT_02923 [Parendozoicomonas haliclonae]